MQELMELAPWAALGLGLLVGSFLNVVILRLPPRLEFGWKRDAREILELPQPEDAVPPGIVLKGSHCPKCGHDLSWYENVPLLSWLALRGRCRACKAPISMQYPIIEALTGVASYLIVWKFGIGADAIVGLILTWMLIAASGIDFRTTLLPDQFTLPLLWLGLIVSVYGLYVDPATAIVGAAVGYLSLWSVFWGFKLLTGKEGMGYGDFKLLAALGAFCGWQGLLPIVLMSSLGGAAIGGLYLVLGNKDSQTQIPFGPFLAVAGWVQFVFGTEIADAYFRLLGMS
ncbi:MAG: A24 family peptidase [Pseudomonadota bacterium]|nr:A24 family peptidase [Pseudomonadota bacterium]